MEISKIKVKRAFLSYNEKDVMKEMRIYK